MQPQETGSRSKLLIKIILPEPEQAKQKEN